MMLERHVKSVVTRKRLRESLAAPYIDGFSDWMDRQGFKPICIDLRLRSLAGWLDWLRQTGYTRTSCLVRGLEACRKELETKGRVKNSRGPNVDSIIAGGMYIRFLRERGVLPKPKQPPSPAERWPIVGEFRSWMRKHRGLRETTLELYEFDTVQMVQALGVQAGSYTARGVRNYFLRRTDSVGPWRARSIATSLRAFLRFLGITGQCPSGLLHAIPTSPQPVNSPVPKYLEPADVQRVIDVCGLDDAYGIRDRAVILLLARLGLRATDVAELTLDQIDWKSGRISVCGKNRRSTWIPLPQEVGDAILKYLREARPKLKIDRVFTRVDAPLGPLTRASVSHIAKSAFRRAKICPPINGAHVFRHSAATAMMRNGVSLAGVGAVLRHGSPRTTTIYAKVDFGLLSSVAQEWPVAVGSEVPSC